ncbi:hypothetical protein V1278_001922 [Bradyrhizobium sp. AZCC 1577]
MISLRLFTLAGLALGLLPMMAPAAERPVVVELFTSQGCSSCPPANAFLNEMTKGRPDVLPLAFHVTYWDRLVGRTRSHWRRPHRVRIGTVAVLVTDPTPRRWWLMEGSAWLSRAAMKLMRPSNRHLRHVVVEVASATTCVPLVWPPADGIDEQHKTSHFGSTDLKRLLVRKHGATRPTSEKTD